MTNLIGEGETEEYVEKIFFKVIYLIDISTQFSIVDCSRTCRSGVEVRIRVSNSRYSRLG